jgi:hypothetical protein
MKAVCLLPADFFLFLFCSNKLNWRTPGLSFETIIVFSCIFSCKEHKPSLFFFLHSYNDGFIVRFCCPAVYPRAQFSNLYYFFDVAPLLVLCIPMSKSIRSAHSSITVDKLCGFISRAFSYGDSFCKPRLFS